MHYAFFNAVLEHLQRLFRVEDNFNLPPMENCFLNLARNLLLNSHREYLEGGEVREDLEGKYRYKENSCDERCSRRP